MDATYAASRPVKSDTPEAVASAVRAATQELRDILQSHGIDTSYEDIALLGHTESWERCQVPKQVQTPWAACRLR